MSVKEIAQPKYLETGTKDIKDVKGVAIKMADSLSSGRLTWILVKRHKVALLALGNIVLLLNTFVPYWTSVIGSFFSGLVH